MRGHRNRSGAKNLRFLNLLRADVLVFGTAGASCREAQKRADLASERHVSAIFYIDVIARGFTKVELTGAADFHRRITDHFFPL